MRIALVTLTISGILLFSCTKTETITNQVSTNAKVNFTFKFDSTQVRLNNLGQPSTLPAGNAAQSPKFNAMSAHYIEFSKDQFTALGSGAVVYKAPEVNTGGANAIDYAQSKRALPNEIFYTAYIKDIANGDYNWLRISLSYQNFDVKIRANGQTLTGTAASFLGFNTYLSSYKIKDSTVIVNGNRAQGYWGLEVSNGAIGLVRTGQAPAGATTVPNPLFASSPVPQGSCVVTGKFASVLKITGFEKNDINIVVSLSTNKSFEWIDVDNNGTYDPLNGDQVIDMGIRGLIPIVL